MGSDGRGSLRRGRGEGEAPCALVRLSARFQCEEAERLRDPALRRAAGAALGARLRNGLRPEDRLRTRFGESFEFLVAAAADSQGARALGERMRTRLSGSLAVGGLRLEPELAMGWAAVERPAAARRDLGIWRAAAVQARTRLRRELTRADSALEALLRAALKDQGLTLLFQPLLDLRGGRISGAEALLRLTAAQAPGPASFIPVAERRGLIRPLGEAALRMAAEAACRWSREAAPGFRLGVNVAPQQLEAEDFPDMALRLCAEARCAPGLLVLEITESTALGDSGAAARRLEILRAAGFRVALDDFGAAHSDLERLSALPADLLKIDAALVERATESAQGARLLESLGALARTLGMETVGEGARSARHLEALRRAGLDYAQGHQVGPPLAEPEWRPRMGEAWPQDAG
ncbi:EAL domain-containing protein [Neomegalonema sp.]|uniref:EAL domain-containing protein n=1 Tax=Neomegalonema sp. TaxID=2039713 RepID=UPI0026335E79|nr:EAL domain-containing protein [Neomegalonema sp.]MDD2867231.1 EAL domain-containing protein [Neomegalonema sp.]